MKTCSFFRRMGLWAGALLLWAGADAAFAQTPNTNFQVAMTLPTNGSSFTPPASVQMDALTFDTADDVAKVVFMAAPVGGGVAPPIVLDLGTVSNGVPVGATGSHQELFTLTWTNAFVGTWALAAEAIRSNGLEIISPPVIITVQRSPVLWVDIASPTNGAVFAPGTDIQLIAGAGESGGAIAEVQFFDGFNSLGVVSNGVVVDPPGSPGLPPGSLAFLLTWSNAPVGIHVLTAAARDTNGQSAISVPVVIVVGSNLPPVVRITCPPDNAVFRAPVNIALLAYARDPLGYVSSVQFFAGSNSLGFGLRVPASVLPPLGPVPPPPPIFQTNIFELIWSNAPAGSNALTAVATDNAGLSATSAPVNITVLPPPPPPTNGLEVVSIVATDPIAIRGTNCWPWLGLSNAPPTWSNWVSPTALWHWITNCGPKDATFAVCRMGETNSDLTVTYSIGGTASNGVDYVALPGVATIPAGQSEVMITVVPTDETNNATETVILSLDASTNGPPDYVVGFPPRAEALIVGGDAPNPGLTGAVLGDHSFRLSGGGPDGAWFRVDCTTNLVNWSPVCTNQVVNGTIDFADPDAANLPARWYRMIPLANPPSD
jgi:hypothetical protein